MKSFYLLPFLFVLMAVKGYGQCKMEDDTLNITGVSVTPTSCPANGVITINGVTGGGGQYAYEITDGPVVRIIQSQNTFNALPQGSYIVRITGCNGDIYETPVDIGGYYNSIYAYGWQNSLSKVSGLLCGATNNGVYKLSKPSYTGGTPPFRIQISNSASFASVPYEPGFDSAMFSGLNQLTTYYVRVTDACNNFITFNFTTPPSTPVVPLSVPTLSFQRAYYYGDCTGKETMYIYLRDSATGNRYEGANTYSNTPIWGTKERPYLRMKIEDRNTNAVYMDRNISVYPSGSNYLLQTDYTLNGETGLPAPGVGKAIYPLSPYPATALPDIYVTSTFPLWANLTVTIYFPGGDFCGTTIPAYSRSFWMDLGQQYPAQSRITGITPNCDGAGNYFRVTFNQAYAGDSITLVKLSPAYTVLTRSYFGTGSNNYTTVRYSPLIPGDTYRVIIKDSCGRSDSMDVVYTPSTAIVPPPAVTDDIKVGYKCPSNPNDAIYNILMYALPAGYSMLSLTLNGFPATSYSTINNWNNSGQTVYQLNRQLPPGTYSYTVTWMNNCQTGSVTKSVTISPVGDPPAYSANMTLSLFTQTGACNRDAFRSINIDAFIKNINTSYKFSYLRLVSGPNAFVYPLYDKMGYRLDMPWSSIYAYQQTVGDSLKINSLYSGLKIGPGQEGLYTIAVDVVCPDGTKIETLTRTINVTATVPSVNYLPNLKYSNALVCASSGSQLKINMIASSGTRPFRFEYKRDTAVNYQYTTSAGADSVVIISPAPDPGTVYDIRVTDACGNTAINRVTVASFTGQFYMYSYPSDCTNNPFNTRVGTSWIRGAYYTWTRNGTIIAQGKDIPYVNLTGVTTDSVTVDIDIYGCYNGNVSRLIVSPNPCDIIVLPVNTITLKAKRLTQQNVQLTWKSVNEQKTIKSFELEKSYDGITFKTITEIKADEKPWEHSYVFDDLESAPLVFYRLKIKAIDGTIKSTPVVRVENVKPARPQITISPNPARDNILLSVAAAKNAPCKAVIFNDKGQTVKEIAVAASEITAKNIDISSLASGSYFLSIVDSWEIVATAKFIKQ